MARALVGLIVTVLLLGVILAGPQYSEAKPGLVTNCKRLVRWHLLPRCVVYFNKRETREVALGGAAAAGIFSTVPAVGPFLMAATGTLAASAEIVLNRRRCLGVRAWSQAAWPHVRFRIITHRGRYCR